MRVVEAVGKWEWLGWVERGGECLREVGRGRRRGKIAKRAHCGCLIEGKEFRELGL